MFHLGITYLRSVSLFHHITLYYTGYTQKNGAVSEVNKQFISHLTGHNVHRQQRQLSTFRMRYQQFASRAYCGASFKMASQQGKAFCVLHFEVSRSVIKVQREFRARFRKDAPHRNNITKWYREFVETGCTADHNSGHATSSLRWTDYRVDVCRVTQGAHIEGLWLPHEKLGQLPCWRCTLCSCKLRNKFLVYFWNRTILLCLLCIVNSVP